MSRKIKELGECLRNGKIFDTDHMIKSDIFPFLMITDNLILLCQIKEGNMDFSSEEFEINFNELIKMPYTKPEFNKNEKDTFHKVLKEYSYWWNFSNEEYENIIKEIKPIIKKEGLPKPKNMDECYHYWYFKKDKKHAYETFEPSKGLVVEYLRYEKSKYDSPSEEVSPATLAVDTHRIALLYELGVISLIEERLNEAGKYSDNKCAQVVVEILGIKDPKRLKTIAGYIRGIKNENDTHNNALSSPARDKVIAVLSKVNLEIKNF
jgi:hypothetical protein